MIHLIIEYAEMMLHQINKWLMIDHLILLTKNLRRK